MSKIKFEELSSDIARTGFCLFLGGSVICIPFVGFGPLIIAVVAVIAVGIAAPKVIDKEKERTKNDSF